MPISLPLANSAGSEGCCSDSIQLDLICTGLVAQVWLVYRIIKGNGGLNLPDSTSKKRRYFIVRVRAFVHAHAFVVATDRDWQPP